MKNGEMLSWMILLVTTRHNGQYDKGGRPYILHLMRVMHKLRTDDEELQCIALGHDLIEDTDTSFEELVDMGFTHRIIQGIRNMTKMPGETSNQYLARIMSSEDSIRVKLSDLQHNSDIRRLKGLTEKDFSRMQKYHTMHVMLTAALREKYLTE